MAVTGPSGLLTYIKEYDSFHTSNKNVYELHDYVLIEGIFSFIKCKKKNIYFTVFLTHYNTVMSLFNKRNFVFFKVLQVDLLLIAVKKNILKKTKQKKTTNCFCPILTKLTWDVNMHRFFHKDINAFFAPM